MKQVEMTMEQLSLVDEAAKSHTRYTQYASNPDNLKKQRLMQEVVHIEWSAASQIHQGDPSYAPSISDSITVGHRLGGQLVVTQEDIDIYNILRPQITCPDAQRAEIIQRVQYGQAEPPPEPSTPGIEIDSFIRNLELWKDINKPSFSTFVETHKVKQGTFDVELWRDLSKESPFWEVGEGAKISVIDRLKREKGEYLLVKIKLDGEQGELYKNNFFLCPAEQENRLVKTTNKEVHKIDEEYKGAPSGSTSKNFADQPADKPYEDFYDLTCRVSVATEQTTQPTLSEMQQIVPKAYRKGIKLILEHYGRDHTDENIDKILEDDTKYDTLFYVLGYRLPAEGGVLKIQVLASISKILALPPHEPDDECWAIEIDSTAQVIENAKKNIRARRKAIEEFKAKGGKIATFNEDTELKSLDFLRNHAGKVQKDDNHSLVLFVSKKDFVLKRASIYSSFSVAEQDKNVVKKLDYKFINPIKEYSRSYYLLYKQSPAKNYTPNKNEKIENWFSHYIAYETVSLVKDVKSDKAKGKKLSKKMQPPVKTPTQLQSEERASADPDKKSEILEKREGEENPNWWKKQFSFEETMKELRLEEEEGFWRNLYEFFFSKTDWQKLGLDAMSCLLEGQVGQNFQKVMNDANVLIDQYGEIKEWYGEFSEKSTKEKLMAVPEFFYPDDLPIDDMSAGFVKSIREATNSILNQLMLSVAKSLFDSILNFCDRPNPELPLPTERVPVPDFDFDRMEDLINALYEGLVTPEQLSDLLGALSTQMSPLELCSLLEGDPADYVVNRAMELVRLYCIDWIKTKEQLIDFFASVGENLDLSFCERVRALADRLPEDDEYLCPPDDTLVRNMLATRGMSDEEVKRQLEEERRKRGEQARDLLNSLLDGVMSGNFTPPSVFCQKDEEGNVQQGTVSFFDDQFKFVMKDTIETVFSSTYKSFQSEGRTAASTYMSEQLTLMKVAPYVRDRRIDVPSEAFDGDRLYPSLLGLGKPIGDYPDPDLYESVISKYKRGIKREPVPYLVKFYEQPEMIARDEPKKNRIQLKFPFDFTMQLEDVAQDVHDLRLKIMNSQNSARGQEDGTFSSGSDCDDNEDRRDEMQELIDNITDGIDANSKSTHIFFDQIYDSSQFVNYTYNCESVGQGMVYDEELGECVCDTGWEPDPDNPGKCRRVVQEQPEPQPQAEVSSEDKCEPPTQVTIPPPFESTPPQQSSSSDDEPEPDRVEDEVQYVITVSGNEQYPATAHSYIKKIPEDVKEFVNSHSQDDYSSMNVLKLLMQESILSCTDNVDTAREAAEILVPSDGSNTVFYSEFRGIILRQIMFILRNSSYLDSVSSDDNPEVETAKKYIIESVNLGPSPNDVCDPHLLKIRQALEDMFDELGDNICLDIHAEKDIQPDGRPRLKPIEEAAISICLKITLRHYLIENITRGMMTHSEFYKLGDDMSDMKLGYIVDKMKLAMDSYSDEYYKGFSSYARQLYKGPEITGKGSIEKRVLIEMMREEYANISYGLHQALLLGDRNGSRYSGVFDNIFGYIARTNQSAGLTMYKEVMSGDNPTFYGETTAADEIVNETQVTFLQATYDRVSSGVQDATDSSKLMNKTSTYICPLAANSLLFEALVERRVEGQEHLIKDPARSMFAFEQGPTSAKLVMILPDGYIHPDDLKSLQQLETNSGRLEHQIKRVLFVKDFNGTWASEGRLRRHYDVQDIERIKNGEGPLRNSTVVQDNSVYGIVIPIYEYKYPGNQGTGFNELTMDFWTGKPLQMVRGDRSSNSQMPIGADAYNRNQEDFEYELFQSSHLRMICKHCFPTREYATLLNVHEMETNIKNINIVANFGETRDALFGAYYALLPQENSWSKQPKAIDDLASSLGLANLFPGAINGMMDINSSLLGLACTNIKYNFGLDVCWGNPFSGFGFSFILKAAVNASLQILKDWIEKNDPNIKLAKKLSFLSQLACIDIPTSATSGIIAASMPWLSTQFTALYNALGLGLIEGGIDSDSEEGEKTRQAVERSGLSLPNYCGENDQVAGDTSLDEAARRGQIVERVSQLSMQEEQLRRKVDELHAFILSKKEELRVVRETIDEYNNRPMFANPFSGRNTQPDPDIPEGNHYVIESSRDANEESLNSLRRRRDNLKGEIRNAEVERDFYISELEYLDENRELIGVTN